MDGLAEPIGSIKPFIGDVLPRGYEDADGQPVHTLWSPMYGQTKPNLTAQAGSHARVIGAMNYRFIIKVAWPHASPLDKIVTEIFAESDPDAK